MSKDKKSIKEEKPAPHPVEEIDTTRKAGEFILPLKPKE